jgi:NagD protein
MMTAYLIDMDGVLTHGSRLIPGAVEFIERLREAHATFMLLTNNSSRTPRDHQARLAAMGLHIRADSIFTSALAVAHFLARQQPHGSAYVIGESGLTTALHAIDYVITDQAPDYVVLGEASVYSMERITTASRLIASGARFIVTSPDVVNPSEHGFTLAPGAIAAMMTAATGIKPYFVGKPNPVILRLALDRLGVHARNAVMIGDRMDTDVLGGIESGLETVLVLSGCTRQEEVARYPYRPDRVVGSVAEINPDNSTALVQRRQLIAA